MTLVSIANEKETHAGCPFRMESLLISRNVHQDLEKLHTTISCQETHRCSSPYYPHLAALRKTMFVFPSSASMLDKVKRIKSLSFFLKLTKTAPRPLAITRIPISSHLWLLAQSSVESRHFMETFQGLFCLPSQVWHLRMPGFRDCKRDCIWAIESNLLPHTHKPISAIWIEQKL